jgi:hypothetical protein
MYPAAVVGSLVGAGTPMSFVITHITTGETTMRRAVWHDLNVDSPRLGPGRTETIAISAPPDAYQASCSVTGHRVHGMVGTLRAVAT